MLNWYWEEVDMKLMKRLVYAVLFVPFYGWKLITANIAIAGDVLRPRMNFVPGTLECPITIRSVHGLFLFSNLVSMTPGTLSLEIDDEREKMLVHVLHAERGDRVLREIQQIQLFIKRITG
jgi:multicomponent Na+:H+ antiporter subunit E